MKAPVFVAIFVAVAMGGAAAPAIAGDGVETALAAMGWGEQWVRTFGRTWESLQARATMPAETVEMVLSLLEARDFAVDAAEAASELYRTVRAVEKQRLGGEPLWRVRLTLEHDLRASGRGLGVVAKGLERSLRGSAKSAGAVGRGTSQQGSSKGRGRGSSDGES